MLAFALRADGWYLRQDIIWHKPNPMPESVRDRCTKAHEYMFLLSKSPRYFIDSEGMREAASGQIAGNVRPVKGSERPDHRTRTGLHAFAERQRSKRDSFKRDGSKREQCLPGQSAGTHRPDREESSWDVSSRNRRSVWTVPTRPYRGAHFATFPPDLIEPCIRAGSRAGDTVLDPFLGSGTTALVSDRQGRHCTGIELNREYADLARRRVEAEGLMFADVKVAA
jgi:DNA modification methylase